MPQSTLEYTVKLLPEAHEIDVTLDVPAGIERLATPTWIPGAYGFMKYGRDLFDVIVEDATGGAPRRLEREGWSGFRLPAHASAARVRWRAYAHDPAWGELVGAIGHDQALLLATHLLFAPEAPDLPCRVRYELPESWPLHHPSGAQALEGATFEYASFAALLDTPVVAGRFERHTRNVRGTPFHFVFLDRAIGFESQLERLLRPLEKIAEQCAQLFGGFPFDDYTFVFTFSPAAKWGLEHAHATLVALAPDTFIDELSLARGLRVSAHELFHAWNGCRLKAAPLGTPDLLNGSFPDALWVTEGATRYYEFLLCARAGVLSPATFFSNVVRYHRQVTSHPAYERVSLLDSSRATFLNHNRYPGSVNATIDYYDAGMLACFELDARLRLDAAPASLDRLMRELFDAFAHPGPGYTHAQVRERLTRLCPAAGEQIARAVEHPAGLNVEASLERLGFAVELEPVPQLGLVLDEDAPAKIANVVDRSPAGRSGIAPLDEILRVNGFPFSRKGLEWLARHERSVELQVTRGQSLLSFTVSPEPARRVGRLVWRGSREQAERIAEWLGAPFTPGPEEAIPLTSFETFHGIQQVL